MKLPRICNYKLLRTNLQNHRSHSVSICGAAIPPSHSVSYPEAAQVKRSQLMLSRSNNRDLSEKQTVALIHNRRRRPYSICAVRVIVHIVFSSLVHIVQFHSITFTSRARARVPIVTQAGHGRAHVISVCLPPARAQDSRAYAALVEHGNFLLPSRRKQARHFLPKLHPRCARVIFPELEPTERQNAYECFTQFAARSRKKRSNFRKRIARLRECRAAGRPDAGYTQPSYRLR